MVPKVGALFRYSCEATPIVVFELYSSHIYNAIRLKNESTPKQQSTYLSNLNFIARGFRSPIPFHPKKFDFRCELINPVLNTKN